MTQTTKDIFEKYQVRKSKKQRADFIDYVKGVCEKYGYEVKTEKGSFGAENIIVGDVDKAKVLYTAHYDTCSRLPFPNFITPKNFLIYLLYQLLIVIGFFAISAILWAIISVIMLKCGVDPAWVYNLKSIVKFIIYLILFSMLVLGPANKHTANDNTSGVTTVLDIMTSLPKDKRDKVAFVLFDLEEAGIIGSASFASNHKDIKTGKLVINYDCVSDGKTILFALKKGTIKYKELLASAFNPTDTIAVDLADKAFYPSDNMRFEQGIGVASMKTHKSTGILYMDKIHTPKDTNYDEENISFLVEGSVRLLELL